MKIQMEVSDRNLVVRLMCIHQLRRPEIRVSGKNGWGDCAVCIPDNENIKCKGYVPVSIFYSGEEGCEVKV